MTLEEALRAQLIGFPGLAALIDGRVLAMAITETTELPAVTWQRISTAPLKHRDGYGLEAIRFQTDGWANSLTEALALRVQMRAAMFGFTRQSGPRVDATLLQDDRDIREPANGRFRASMDFVLWATES